MSSFRSHHYRCSALAGMFLLLVLAWSPSHAQYVSAPTPQQQVDIQSSSPIAPPCIGCYTGFQFDSVFRMGAHFNGSWPGSPQFLKNTLHIGITQMYGQPYLKDIFYPTVLGDARAQWVRGLQQQFWTDVKAADLKVVLQPGVVSAIAKGSEMSEAYFAQAASDTLHRIDFAEEGAPDASDRLPGSFVWGGRFNGSSASNPPPLKMASGPTWTAMGIAQDGFYLPSQSASIGKYDIAVTLKTDVNATQFVTLGSSDLIAYVKLYRRIPVGQGICDCNLFEYIDSLPITKAVYLDSSKSDVGAGNGYRDVTFSFPIPEPTITVSSPITITLGVGDVVTALSPGTYPKYVPRKEFIGWHDSGTYHEDTNSLNRFIRYCGRLKGVLIDHNVYYDSSTVFDHAQMMDHGDFGYEIWTTRKVDLTLLRGRLAPHTYALLRRGEYDSTISRAVDTVFSDTSLGGAMNGQLFRFGVVDEHAPEKYRGYMDVASRMQWAILANAPNDKRGIWANPQADGASFRVMSGDLDTTDIRTVHMAANQWYSYGGLIPVTYANPDSMQGSAALTGLYRAAGSGHSIMYNTVDDYKRYTVQTLEDDTARINQLAVMTNAARFMFRNIRRESYPVYSVVQVHGYLEGDDHIGYTNPPTWHFPVVTPEEITVQAWLALNCGVDGLWFSDFTYDDAREFGVMHWLTMNTDSNYQDTLHSGDASKLGNPNWMLPRMWTGFKDRFNAVKRVTDDFHADIIPVYQSLDHNGIRMNVWRDAFFAMPMLDTLYTVRAARLKTGGAYSDSIVTGTTTLRDLHDSTFIAATVFKPGSNDTDRYSRYLLVTNLRCWPYDERTYSAYTDTFCKTVDPAASTTAALGAIDARKPVVILKNSTGVIADSVRVQRIGDVTSRVFAFGDTVELDWLDPGWGAMYRLTPILKPISGLGTAYNNAVHSLNPSDNSAARDRLFVYERDSAVYLRALDSNGRWGPEQLLSRPADTVTITAGGKSRNTADNMFPAIDMIRNGGSSCMIVWEHHDVQTDSVSVEALWLSSKPTVTSFPTSGMVRGTLTRPRKFAQSWMQLTPAITGVDSGYVVAWAAPNYTTEVIAVRDNITHSPFDTSRTLRVKMIKMAGIMPSPTQPDSAVATPTLAYVRNWAPTALNGGILSGPDSSIEFLTMPPQGLGVKDTIKPLHIVHLAYSQGRRGSPHAFSIMYNRIGVTFPPRNSGAIPRLWASPTEEASINIPGCDRIYPSIAADSARVGVTFTARTAHDQVYLRFKNAGVTGPLSWNTTAYVWGGGSGGSGASARSYERSSVTMFPSRLRTPLQSSFEGAMTWQWTNPAGNRHNGVKLYRFGRYAADSLPDGQHPTMMLVPRVGSSAGAAITSSGVFRRGSDSELFVRPRPRGDSGVYYPAYFDNTPVSPIVAFSTPPPTATIHAEGEIRKPLPFLSGCETVEGGIRTGILLHPNLTLPQDPIPPVDTVGPLPNGSMGSLGMPPTFFPQSSGSNIAMTSVSELGNITRTPSFRVDTTTITITRTAIGDDSLMSWLNNEPNDPITGLPANIRYSLQVVRDSDGVVLWTGDTISARGVAADTVVEDITIPVQSVAAMGTKVHVALVAVTTNSLNCSVAGGFYFGGEGGGLPSKRLVVGGTAVAADKAIGVRMIPNPLYSASGELRIEVAVTGPATIAIYDLLGNRVMTLPAIDVRRAGEYAIPVDLSALRDGTYLVDVRSGSGRGSTRITVIR